MLLLDEPMSNLDVALRVKMREEIREIQQKIGIGIIDMQRIWIKQIKRIIKVI